MTVSWVSCAVTQEEDRGGRRMPKISQLGWGIGRQGREHTEHDDHCVVSYILPEGTLAMMEFITKRNVLCSRAACSTLLPPTIAPVIMPVPSAQLAGLSPRWWPPLSRLLASWLGSVQTCSWRMSVCNPSLAWRQQHVERHTRYRDKPNHAHLIDSRQ